MYHSSLLDISDPIDVRIGTKFTSNSEVLLRINLRRIIHFDYQIEFVDMTGDVIDTMEGVKGKETFQHIVSVHEGIKLMARFRIGEVIGPNSESVIDVTEGMLIFNYNHRESSVMQIRNLWIIPFDVLSFNEVDTELGTTSQKVM